MGTGEVVCDFVIVRVVRVLDGVKGFDSQFVYLSDGKSVILSHPILDTN